MNTVDIDRVLTELDALAAEDQHQSAPPRVQARVMAEWDERIAAAPSRALRWWNYAGLAALSAAVVLLAVGIRPTTRTNQVHTTGTSGSEIVLADGSRVEMRAESELSLGRAADGIRIRLARGSIIVHAAKQRSGYLYVQTKDVTVSVVGTVFFVDAEEEGSRVAVIEGEVQVRHGATEQNVGPGQQVLTGARFEPIPVRQEIAWSRRATELAHALQRASQIASAQPRPEFEVADVRASQPRADGRSALQMEGGGAVRGGRYEIHDATMVDLVRTAYGVEADAVVGGPSWLAVDRFDVVAKPWERTPLASINLMLQSLLADRFKLVVREDTRPMPAWVLSKGAGDPKLKPADSLGESSCRVADNNERLSCRNVTLDAFLARLRENPISTRLPVVNATGLEGSWDFDLNYTIVGGDFGFLISENNPVLNAIEKQLGLTLELQNIPQPVLIVESVNRTPTANAADVGTRLPPDPVEFEIASLRRCESVDPFGQRISPAGHVTTGCERLLTHIVVAWNLCPPGPSGPGCRHTDVVKGPSWLESKIVDIVAKAPIPIGGRLVFDPSYRTMLRNLLVDRFKMVTHYEDRITEVYTLVAAKPKLRKADPSSRAGCKSNGGAFLRTVITCQNVTMAQFAEHVSRYGVVNPSWRPVVDASGIQGTWDLTLTFGGRPARARPANADGVASDPTGVATLREAIEQQLGLKLEEARRPMPVFVIDHIEENPTEN